MFELQVFIPIAGNNGVAFTGEDHGAFEAFVVDRFGGITRYPASAIGAWVDAGVTYRDDLVVYGIVVKSITDGGKVAEVVTFAKAHYAQIAIFIRYLGLTEIL